MINLAAIRRAPRLLADAARAGWRTDDVINVAPLPANREAQKKLDSAGVKRPVHDSGHQRWNAEVDEEIREIGRTLRAEGLESGTDAYGRRARELLEELQDQLRQKLLKSGRLTQNDLGMSPETI